MKILSGFTEWGVFLKIDESSQTACYAKKNRKTSNKVNKLLEKHKMIESFHLIMFYTQIVKVRYNFAHIFKV